MDQSIGLLPKKLLARYSARQHHDPPNSLRLRPLQPDTSLIGPTTYFGTGKKAKAKKATQSKKLKTGGKMPSSFMTQNGIIGDFMSLKPLSKPKSLVERLRRK
jgi:hypothetical protein